VAADAEARWRELAAGVDPTGLRAEQNIFRLRRIAGTVVIRAGSDVSDTDLAVARAVAAVVGVDIDSSPPTENDDAFVARIARAAPAKVRLLGTHDDRVRRALHHAGVWLDDTPVVADGASELLRWTREQSVSRTMHRHGNIISSAAPCR